MTDQASNPGSAEWLGVGTGPEAQATGLDAMLDRLDKIIGRLANSKAPIEDLVRDYEEAVGLMAAAQARYEALSGGAPP